MSRIEDRAKSIAKAAKEAAIKRGVEQIENIISDDLPVVVRAVEEGIELRGRGLLRRLVSDPRLRWIGQLLR